MLANQLTYLMKVDSAGTTIGARVSAVLSSPAYRAEARLSSCAVAVAMIHGGKFCSAPVVVDETASG